MTEKKTETKAAPKKGSFFLDLIILAVTAWILYGIGCGLITHREERIREVHSQLIGNTYEGEGIHVTVLDDHKLSYTSKKVTEPEVMEYEVTVGAITGIARIHVNDKYYDILLDNQGKITEISFEGIHFFD